MSGLFRIAGVAMIIVCALTLYASLEQSGRSVTAEPAALLHAIRHSLSESGLHRREDVLIEINGREVALGFSRPGCDGLLLVTVLPHTAQGWAHMAPRLDLSTYRLAFLHDGVQYPSVPRIERLAVQLRGDLGPHRTRTFPQVIAIAEAGQCGLAPKAAAVLEAISRGRVPFAVQPESVPNLEEVSA